MKVISYALPFVGLAIGAVGIKWPTVGAVLLTGCVVGLLLTGLLRSVRHSDRPRVIVDSSTAKTPEGRAALADWNTTFAGSFRSSVRKPSVG